MRNMATVLCFCLSTFLFSNSASAQTPAIIDAVRDQDIRMVRELLQGGANPNATQSDGATALHWAVYHENEDLSNELIGSGANVDTVNRLGASALYLAAKSGNAALITRILDAGADPDVALPMGETPLMTASRAGTVEGVRALLEAGADVNASEKSRYQTALMWAAAQGHVDVARLLVNAGANLEARSKVRSRLMFADASNGGAFDQGIMENLGGFTPLLFAARNGDVEMARLFLSAEANIDGLAGNGTSPLVVAAHSGHSQVAQLLLEQGADANAMEAGYSAMHAAILRGDLATVEALLENGADPDARLLRPNPVQRASEDWALKTPLVGATPYWIAASFREAEIMRALSAAGANALLTNEGRMSRPRNREDRESYTPTTVGGYETALQAAIKGDSTRGRYYVQPNPDPVGEEQLALAAVRAILDEGVDVNHVDYTQSTALHDAAARGLPNVVRELLAHGADDAALNSRGLTPLELAIAAENRPNFFGFDTSIPGPSVSEILRQFRSTQ